MGSGHRAAAGEPGVPTRTVELLQDATRMLAGVALQSMEVLDDAVTLPQFRLLAVLADLGTVPTGQAARALGLDPSTVTRLADKLVGGGYVIRGGDRRHRGVVTLELTGSGRDLVVTAASWRQRELARIMSRLAPADQEKVATALALLIEAAGEGYGLAARSLVPL
jgi:DNA-binding MarR family transcriptional regulator